MTQQELDLNKIKFELEENRQEIEQQLNVGEDDGVYITEINGEFISFIYKKKPTTESIPSPMDFADEEALNPAWKKTESELGKPSIEGRSILMGMGLGILVTVGSVNYWQNISPRPFSSPEVKKIESIKVPKQEKSSLNEKVKTLVIQPDKIQSKIIGSGVIAPYQVVEIKSPLAQLALEQVLVQEGAFVVAGQLLARFDDSVLENKLKQAQQAIIQAQNKLNTLKQEVSPAAITQSQLQITNAQQDVLKAQSELSYLQQLNQRNRALYNQGVLPAERLAEMLKQEQTSQSNLITAQNRLEQAQQQLAQLRSLPNQKELEQAQTELEQANKQVSIIKEQIKQTLILAPVTGRIVKSKAIVDSVVEEGQPLFEIIQNDRQEAHLQVESDELSAIVSGQTVEISANSKKLSPSSNQSLPAQIVLGKVKTIEIAKNQSSKATVIIDLPNKLDWQIGTFLQATIITGEKVVVKAPTQALVSLGKSKATAYIIQNDRTVKKVQVTTGRTLNDGQMEIIKGLQPGERIAIKGITALKEGEKVALLDD